MGELEAWLSVPPALFGSDPVFGPRERWLEDAKRAGVFDGPSWAPHQMPPGLEWIEEWARL